MHTEGEHGRKCCPEKILEVFRSESAQTLGLGFCLRSLWVWDAPAASCGRLVKAAASEDVEELRSCTKQTCNQSNTQRI